MSGGHWEYKNDYVAQEIFAWRLYPDYGKDGFKDARKARSINPLEDKQLSEMLWDMFCLLHSYDWYISGDCCEETYRADVAYFKKKWLKPTPEDQVRREIEKTLEEAKEELFKTFGINDSNCTLNNCSEE